MADAPLPVLEAGEVESDRLTDIIWFIHGRMSAGCGELGTEHIEALRRFHRDRNKIDELRHRCHAAEHREMLAKHFASLAKPLPPRGKKAGRA